MKKNILITFLIIIIIAGLTYFKVYQKPISTENGLSGLVTHNSSVTLDTSSELAQAYKTQLTEALSQPANFAGHYVVTTTTCGKSCTLYLVVDKNTGKVFEGPKDDQTFGNPVDSDPKNSPFSLDKNTLDVVEGNPPHKITYTLNEAQFIRSYPDFEHVDLSDKKDLLGTALEFKSKYFKVSFKYPFYWGEPTETLSNIGQKNCKPDDEYCNAFNGKAYALSFSKPFTPRICILSKDYGVYEYGQACYRGEVGVEDYYNKISEDRYTVSKTPYTSLDINGHHALLWIASEGELGGASSGQRLILKLNNKEFPGMQIDFPLFWLHEYVPEYLIKNKNFVEAIKKGDIDIPTQNYLMGYQVFISTLKIEE